MADKQKSKRGGLDKQALKDFRHKVSQLKKKGIVSAKVDARSQRATRYMRSKVRKFEDVLSGHAIAVKAPKKIREKYTTPEIFQERGSFLIVPKEHARSRARIKKGRDLIEIITPLGWGEEREVVLPFDAKNMIQLANQIATHPGVNDLKKADEQFAFRLFGHNSRKAFVDNDEFADYVLRNYQHLFKGKSGAQAIKHLSVIRFKGYVDQVPEPDESASYYEAPSYNIPRRMDKKGRNSGQIGTYEKQIRAKRAANKKKKREKETPQERAKRLSDQRQRSARNRQRKFEDK